MSKGILRRKSGMIVVFLGPKCPIFTQQFLPVILSSFDIKTSIFTH